MPYCTNCGALLKDGSRFCSDCGSPINATNNTAEGSITFERNACAVAKLMPAKITIDGMLYGELRENESITLRLSPGSHIVYLKVAMNPPLTIQVNIQPGRNIYYPFKVSFTGKPVCTIDEYYL